MHVPNFDLCSQFELSEDLMLKHILSFQVLFRYVVPKKGALSYEFSGASEMNTW